MHSIERNREVIAKIAIYAQDEGDYFNFISPKHITNCSNGIKDS